MTACLSDLRFDEWLAGELAGEAAADAASHVAGCRACRDRRHALAAERDRFRAALPSIAPRPPRRRAAIAGIGAAAAAAAVVVVAMLARDDAGGTRTKGGAHLGFAVLHAGAMRIGAAGEVVHPGDTLSYLVTSAAPAYVAVLGRDAAGRVTIYVPGERVGAGRDVELSIATRLDDTLGREQIAAVLCPGATMIAAAIAAIIASAGDPPPGCTIDRIAIEKAPAP